MRETRNPFRLRTTERIDSDAAFLRLFSPGMLDLLPTEELWDKPRMFRSAPGGGKTSLLRLFTPTALKMLDALRHQDDVQDLWDRMARLGALDDSGPVIFGVYLVCNRSYASLDDDYFEPHRRDRLFFGLLNTRITIAALRSALQLRGLEFPEHLPRLQLNLRAETWFPGGVENGQQLFDWAVLQESSICDAVDSFGDVELENLPGQSVLASTALFMPGVLSIDGFPVGRRSLLMLDDLQQLTQRQRTLLMQTIASSRSGVPIWLAERFEALTTPEMLESGAVEGRDYEKEVLIEHHWRRHPKRFEAFVMNVGDRRARLAVDVDVTSLAGSLEQQPQGEQWKRKLDSMLPQVRTAAERAAAGSPLYSEWIQMCSSTDGNTPYEKLVQWRTLEILIHRQQGKRQQALSFALPSDELESKNDAGTRAAAELFLANEFGLPYYFGPARLATLASCNLEQFLRLAGEEFEEIIAANVLRKTPLLSASKQDAIAKAVSRQLWDEVPRRATRHGEDVRRLLHSIASFSAEQTFRPNAPYSPGVTGIAISMSDRELMMSPEFVKRHPQHGFVSEVLAAAIAQNFLEPLLSYKVKGGTWMVMYLNRALCPHFKLSLQYGGFRERKLSELYQWAVEGYRPSRKLVDQ